jgi:hypothetical protein
VLSAAVRFSLRVAAISLAFYSQEGFDVSKKRRGKKKGDKNRPLWVRLGISNDIFNQVRDCSTGPARAL